MEGGPARVQEGLRHVVVEAGVAVAHQRALVEGVFSESTQEFKIGDALAVEAGTGALVGTHGRQPHNPAQAADRGLHGPQIGREEAEIDNELGGAADGGKTDAVGDGTGRPRGDECDNRRRTRREWKELCNARGGVNGRGIGRRGPGRDCRDRRGKQEGQKKRPGRNVGHGLGLQKQQVGLPS